jgi:hypothetical protein
MHIRTVDEDGIQYVANMSFGAVLNALVQQGLLDMERAKEFYDSHATIVIFEGGILTKFWKFFGFRTQQEFISKDHYKVIVVKAVSKT